MIKGFGSVVGVVDLEFGLFRRRGDCRLVRQWRQRLDLMVRINTAVWDDDFILSS